MTTLRQPRPAGSFVELVHTMGTVVTIDVRAADRPRALDAAVLKVTQQLHQADEWLSTWREDSWVSRLGSGRARIGDCPSAVRRVIALADELEVVTDGYFSAFWRRGAATAARGPDPTGLVKGWAAQRASDILLAHGLHDHVVNAAGDIVLSGTPATGSGSGPAPGWRIGISHPLRPGELAGAVDLESGPSRWAIATSGLSEQGCHVVDPHSGVFPSTVASATAVVRTGGRWHEAGAVADACATALVAAGSQADALLDRLHAQDVRALVIDSAGMVTDRERLLSGC